MNTTNQIPNTSAGNDLAGHIADPASEFDEDTGLPYCSAEAVVRSQGYATRYLEAHQFPKSGLDDSQVAGLATARLQWLLQHGRAQLRGRFTVEDVNCMMSCFQDALFFPDQMGSLAGEVAAEFGLEPDDWEQSPLAPLLTKLFALDVLERLALADALEQAWHRAAEGRGGPTDVLAQLGIELQG